MQTAEPTTKNVTYTKVTLWHLFNKPVLSRSETYSEVESEGTPYQVVISQDYYNKEFKTDGKENNGKV